MPAIDVVDTHATRIICDVEAALDALPLRIGGRLCRQERERKQRQCRENYALADGVTGSRLHWTVLIAFAR